MGFKLLRMLLFSLTIILLTVVGGSCFASSNSIEKLTAQIQSTSNSKELSKLYCYRARGYSKVGDTEKANKDYLKALNSSYSGWLMNEYGYFLYKNGDYKRAYVVAKKTIKDFPHLQQDATKLKNKSKDKYNAAYAKRNPETIVVSEQNLKRNQVTKYDLTKNKGYRKMNVIKAKTPAAKPKSSSSGSSSKPSTGWS